jgi:hypothetical protein
MQNTDSWVEIAINAYIIDSIAISRINTTLYKATSRIIAKHRQRLNEVRLMIVADLHTRDATRHRSWVFSWSHSIRTNDVTLRSMLKRMKSYLIDTVFGHSCTSPIALTMLKYKLLRLKEMRYKRYSVPSDKHIDNFNTFMHNNGLPYDSY